jgi:hypothetical protein
VRDKLPYDFEDMGERSVKNVARPVRAFAMSAAAVARTPLVPVLPLVPVVTKASSLPEKLALLSIMGSQIRAFTVDGTLIDIGAPRYDNVSVGYGKARTTRTDTTVTYIFQLNEGKRHYPVELTNFSLPFAAGVTATFLCFEDRKRQRVPFSVYNHSDPRWIELPPFKTIIDLSNDQPGSLASSAQSAAISRRVAAHVV